MRLFELVRLATPLWCIINALLALSLKLYMNKENLVNGSQVYYVKRQLTEWSKMEK